MSTPIPIFLIAQHLQACQLYGSNPTAGAITWTTLADLAAAAGVGVFDGITFRSDATLEMIRPADLLINNNLIVGYDFDVVLREVQPVNGSGNLVGAVTQYTHGKVVASYKIPGGSTTYYIGAMGVWGPLEWSIQSGRNVATVTLKPTGYNLYVGTTAPTF